MSKKIEFITSDKMPMYRNLVEFFDGENWTWGAVMGRTKVDETSEPVVVIDKATSEGVEYLTDYFIGPLNGHYVWVVDESVKRVFEKTIGNDIKKKIVEKIEKIDLDNNPNAKLLKKKMPALYKYWTDKKSEKEHLIPNEKELFQLYKKIQSEGKYNMFTDVQKIVEDYPVLQLSDVSRFIFNYNHYNGKYS